jgi:hypothetical protein
MKTLGGDEHAEIHGDRFHDEGGDPALREPRLDAPQGVGVEGRLDLVASGKEVLAFPAVVGGPDAEARDRVAVIAVLEGEELAAPVWIMAAWSARSTASDPPVARKHFARPRGATDSRRRASSAHGGYE